MACTRASLSAMLLQEHRHRQKGYAMKVGLVGFSGSGSTTIFNTLTGLQAEVGPHGRKGKANLGVIDVPDSRVDTLAQLYTPPKRKVFAKIEFIDLIGPSEANTGSALSAEAITLMRDVDALVHVVRAFVNPALAGEADPARDLKAFEDELILSDLVQIDKRLEKLEKDRSPEHARERDALKRCQEHLVSGRPLRQLTLTPDVLTLVAGFCFLSQKPMLALLNTAKTVPVEAVDPKFVEATAAQKIDWMILSGQEEMEITQLDAETQLEFLKDLGLREPARDRFIRAAYKTLDLISFLTVGKDECRAWPIKRGTTARQAAGKVHSDMERGFIRAEVIAFEEFIKLGSEAHAREAGKLRLEGKDYLVRDGDMIHFRFNV